MQVFARCVYFIVTFISSDFLHCSNINMSNKHFSESLNRHNHFFSTLVDYRHYRERCNGSEGSGGEKRRKKGA